MRRPLVAGNWKMNGSSGMVDELLTGVLSQTTAVENVAIAVLPPFVYLSQVVDKLRNTPIFCGAQNVSEHVSGAFTGEVSVSMVQELNCHYVLVGHSERRHIYEESDAQIAQKFAIALQYGLVPMLCVGETEAEREQGQTEAVVMRQIQAVLDEVGIAGLDNAVVAYEPVWAIGTGKTATPEQAQAVHHYIRAQLATHDAAIADKLQILYGGSVKADNAADIFAMADIDGGLIGGASLKADEFANIIRAA